jgi:hypothetical protein
MVASELYDSYYGELCLSSQRVLCELVPKKVARPWNGSKWLLRKGEHRMLSWTYAHTTRDATLSESIAVKYGRVLGIVS